MREWLYSLMLKGTGATDTCTWANAQACLLTWQVVWTLEFVGDVSALEDHLDPPPMINYM